VVRGIVVLLVVWLPLMATSPAADAAPLKMPSRAGIRAALDDVGRFVAGDHQKVPKTPRQQTGTAAGRPHQVPQAVTRAVARARGHRAGRGRGQLPAYRVHAPAKRRFTTGAAAGGGHFNASTSTLIGSKSTATSEVYKNADGTFTRHVYAAPVNYQTSAGTWAPIDTRLVAAAAGGWHEAANSVGVTFAASSAAPALGSLRFGGGNQPSFGLSFGLAGAAGSPGTASGSSVTYPGVLPDTDLVETSTAVGISESLILHSAQAPASWAFPLRLDGSVALEDAAGTVVATIPGGVATDSSGRAGSAGSPSGAGGVGSGAATPVTYQLVTSNGEPALRATLDASWLANPARVFPVTVDPSVNSTTTGSTMVLNPYDADYSGSALLDVGTYDAPGQTPPTPTPPVSTPSPDPDGNGQPVPHRRLRELPLRTVVPAVRRAERHAGQRYGQRRDAERVGRVRDQLQHPRAVLGEPDPGGLERHRPAGLPRAFDLR
jgi:hypothetical protein